MIGLALGAAALAPAALLARGVFSPRSGLLGPVVWRGDRGDPPRVALTFDDGPDARTTPRVLDVLEQHGVRAAFFVIGRYAEAEPGLLRRIDDGGHLIGNHSWSHAYSGALRRGAYWRAELARTNDAIARAVGRPPRLFRPPMGFKNPHVTRAARRHGLVTVTWSQRALDGRATSPARIVRRLADRPRGGDIVLMHDGVEPRGRGDRAATIAALPDLVAAWRERGLALVRLDELIDVDGGRRGD